MPVFFENLTNSGLDWLLRRESVADLSSAILEGDARDVRFGCGLGVNSTFCGALYLPFIVKSTYNNPHMHESQH